MKVGAEPGILVENLPHQPGFGIDGGGGVHLGIAEIHKAHVRIGEIRLAQVGVEQESANHGRVAQICAIETDAGENAEAEVEVGQRGVGGALIDDLPDFFRLGIDDGICVEFDVFEKRKIEIRLVEGGRAEIDTGQVDIKKTSAFKITETAIDTGQLAGVKNCVRTEYGE